MNATIFIGYFLDQGYKNPYGGTDPVVYIGRNSSQDFDGRMRFDETECSSGSSKKQISLWVKTHKDYINKTIAKEKGYNTYKKVEDERCKYALKWWNENYKKWTIV